MARLKILQFVDIEFMHQGEAALENLVCIVGGRGYSVLVCHLGKDQRGDLTTGLIVAVHGMVHRGRDHRRAIHEESLPATCVLAVIELRYQEVNHVVQVQRGWQHILLQPLAHL